MKYDLAVIGGGPGGYTAAARAAKEGLSVVLFEKDALGGTCLNRGCIPTKALLRAAGTLTACKNAGTLGIFAENISFDFSAVHARKRQAVETLRQGIEKLMKAGKVTVISGVAKIVSPGVISCAGQTCEATDIIIAVGTVPAKPPIPGLDTQGVCTSDDLLEGEGRMFSSLVIIGGGVIGVEFASFYQAIGCQVTILEAMDRILPPLDKEIAQRIGVYFRKRGISVNAKASVKRVEKTANGLNVTYLDKTGVEKSVTAEGVLVATGRKAVTAELFEGGDAPELVRGAISADAVGRTTLPHLYVIGDAKAGNIQLAHVAAADAENTVAAILGKKPPVDMTVVPSCIFTDPEIASVGMTEDQAKNAGIPVKTSKYLTGANGKCLIEEAESGYVKLVCSEENGQILGAQLVCPHATDLVGELAVAVQKKLTAAEIAEVIHPHPTFCEMVARAAEEL